MLCSANAVEQAKLKIIIQISILSIVGNRVYNWDDTLA
jgi:hypothetical protein